MWFRGAGAGLAGLVLLALPHCCSAGDFPTLATPVGQGPVQEFALKDYRGDYVSPAKLRGKVWIAHFFFTTCLECNKTTIPRMVELQKAFAGKRDVALVSISLNDDTAENLQQFARDMKADPRQWFFLTGPKPQVHQLVRDVFYQSAVPAREPEPGKEIDHDLNLLVIDHEGTIRGYVGARDPRVVGAIHERVKELVWEKYRLPAVNAALNSLCAALLTLGYLSIRRGWETLHAALMLSALAVSAAFLASYLYFHFVVLGGQATGFRGDGWIRPVYFSILISHTILAAVVPPLALTVAYQGLRDQRRRHVRLARWTLPIWLYVSVSGVVVYWMLYHLYPPI